MERCWYSPSLQRSDLATISQNDAGRAEPSGQVWTKCCYLQLSETKVRMVTKRRVERSKQSHLALKRTDTCTSAKGFVPIRHPAVPRRLRHAFQLYFSTNDSDSASSVISSEGWFKHSHRGSKISLQLQFYLAVDLPGAVLDSSIQTDLWMTSSSKQANKYTWSTFSTFTSVQDTTELYSFLFSVQQA